ncbi:cytochrome C biogenesis protein ResC [Aeromicrobium sp. Root495]|uniref:cytochrome c biogenesis CcdA family protein n=1 Tax=Aeromicrobium sp. Root495 TaxID=1736550 RepID=UPI0006FDF5A4|nr:cytochrome c biogenesis protein CcdA [Aeromicrobium sp. Root495]KQY55310.1 cytochrome C biogenesis protein ResC [Aeromicrobium sp. Root495]
MGDWFAASAASGTLLLAVPVAVVAGLVSFFSPCLLPLLPGYLSYVSGLSGADLQARHRGRVLAGAALFVAGFSAVFISYGALFGAIGFKLLVHQSTVNLVLGILTIAMGLVFMGYVPFAQRELRINAVPRIGVAAAPVLGILFGVGWTPCLGPTLAVVLSLSTTAADAGRGSLLTFFYCAGLGLPFILAAVAYRRMLGTITWVRAHAHIITRVGGLLMVAVGVLLVTGLWLELISQLQQLTLNYVAPV